MSSWIFSDAGYWRSSDADIDKKLILLDNILSVVGPTPITFKCALVGTHCQNIRIVDVPLRCGAYSAVKPLDLDVMLWIPPCKRGSPHIVDFSRNQFVVDRYPFNGENILDATYTFYYQPQQAARTRWDCGNNLIDAITNYKGATWFGDILVIKTNSKGIRPGIVHVVDDDIPIICDIMRCAMIDGRLSSV